MCLSPEPSQKSSPTVPSSHAVRNPKPIRTDSVEKFWDFRKTERMTDDWPAHHFFNISTISLQRYQMILNYGCSVKAFPNFWPRNRFKPSRVGVICYAPADVQKERKRSVNDLTGSCLPAAGVDKADFTPQGEVRHAQRGLVVWFEMGRTQSTDLMTSDECKL